MNPLSVFFALVLAAGFMAVALGICGYVFKSSDNDSTSSEGVKP